jgi:tripartite-type tricarboxylate transporter receptor subunit TctC
MNMLKFLQDGFISHSCRPWPPTWFGSRTKPSPSFPRRRESITLCHLAQYAPILSSRKEGDTRLRGNDDFGFDAPTQMSNEPLKRSTGFAWACKARFAATIALAAISAATQAQDYPTRPIRIVTSEAGGGNDLQARLVAKGLTAALGQQVIVENRPSGVIPGDIVARANPNGYTLLLYNNTFWIGPLLQTTPYDPLKDFAAVTTVAVSPNILVVNQSLPVKFVAELIALAKSKPGELNYASSGTGATNHLAAELLNAMAGIKIVRVSYKGAGQAMNDLIAGQVHVAFPTAGAAAGHMRAGRVRALAVTSSEPSPFAPGLPTVAASVPGYETIAIYGLFVPARTPAAIVQRLHREAVQVVNSADVREKLNSAAVESVGDAPDQLFARVRGDMARMKKVIDAAGISAK